MTLAIVGSRGFNDYEGLKESLLEYDLIETCTKVVSGGARGADSLGERFANEFNIPIEVIKPNWDAFGKAAGFIRNTDIVNKCDVLIAFWDGQSRGTLDSINKARAANKRVIIVEYNNGK